MFSLAGNSVGCNCLGELTSFSAGHPTVSQAVAVHAHRRLGDVVIAIVKSLVLRNAQSREML